MAEIVKMLAMFPVPGQSDQLQELRLAGYLDVIGGFPLWAVEKVCTKVRRGVYPQLNRAFAPTAAELAEIIRDMLAKEGQPDAAGGIKFDGEIPMTWVVAQDPRWDELCCIEKAANPKSKPYAMTSKYAPGLGRFFRSEYVDALPLTHAEREGRGRLVVTGNLPTIATMPPPRSLTELRALKPGATVSYEEAMILTDGRPPVGRFEDAEGARARTAKRAGPARSDADLKAAIAERLRASQPPRAEGTTEDRMAP